MSSFEQNSEGKSNHLLNCLPVLQEFTFRSNYVCTVLNIISYISPSRFHPMVQRPSCFIAKPSILYPIPHPFLLSRSHFKRWHLSPYQSVWLYLLTDKCTLALKENRHVDGKGLTALSTQPLHKLPGKTESHTAETQLGVLAEYNSSRLVGV
jgi:hypothetical protein